MGDKITSELNELMKKDRIETEEAVNYLKKVSREYIVNRDELLRDKQRGAAKVVHDELADIYCKVANKVSDGEVRKSLETFVFYWRRSGETEIFIEPSLPQVLAQLSSEVWLDGSPKTGDLPVGFFNDLIDKIEEVIRLSPTEKNSLREKPSRSCSVRNLTDLSGQIGVNESVIKSYFEAIRQDSVLKQKLGRSNYERVIEREYDVELVGAVYSDLKDSIEKSETEDAMKYEIFNTVERSAEKNTVDNFIRCDDNLKILDGVLQTLVDRKDIFKFVVSIIRSRVGIPHYESTIFAFDMVRYMVNHSEIESRIDTNIAEKILNDDLDLLITELKLREIMFNRFENVAESFAHNETNKEDARKLIIRVLEIYVNVLNITRSRFS